MPDGKTFDPPRDDVRLRRQYYRTWAFMSDGKWHTLAEIARAARGSTPSVSARLRDFRKRKFGGHTVERTYVGNGTWAYRLIPRIEGGDAVE